MRFTKILILAGSTALIAGCATKDYVNENVTDLENRHESMIGEIDQTSREALERAIAAGRLAEGQFLYDIVLTDDAVKFPVDRAELSPAAQDRLVALANQLKSENVNVYLEIQGHTDSTGSAEYNDRLGLDRADAVRLFLNRQGVPLNRMATISYGESVPMASNITAQGRSQNRRVAIVVLK